MEAKRESEPFRFKQFSIKQERCTMKVGTDGVLLGAWVSVEGAGRILDIGSGSGVIAIMLAQRTKKALIEAVEIDGASCVQAGENMLASPWAERLAVFHSSIQDFAAATAMQYDLIVSNPPFFTGGNLSYNQDRNSVRHTIKLSHHDLLSSVRRLLSEQGRFCVILPYIEGLRFCELATTYQLYNTRITEVHPKAEKPVERLLLQFEKVKKDVEVQQLVIQHSEGNAWTTDYKALTKAFYLKI